MNRFRLPASALAPCRRRRWALGTRLFAAALLLLAAGPAGRALAQSGGPLVDHYSVKLGASYARSFIEVTRNSDSSQAALVSDSDFAPYASLSTPPFFLGGSGLAFGIALSYARFTASQQEFPGSGPASIGSTAEGTMLILAPSVSYYVGRDSASQYLRLTAGQGWGWARLSGNVQFGNTPGAEPPEPLESPSGASPAVFFGVEYRVGWLSLAYYGGGPLIETPTHTIRLGDDSVVLALVFNL